MYLLYGLTHPVAPKHPLLGTRRAPLLRKENAGPFPVPVMKPLPVVECVHLYMSSAPSRSCMPRIPIRVSLSLSLSLYLVPQQQWQPRWLRMNAAYINCFKGYARESHVLVGAFSTEASCSPLMFRRAWRALSYMDKSSFRKFQSKHKQTHTPLTSQ